MSVEEVEGVTREVGASSSLALGQIGVVVSLISMLDCVPNTSSMRVQHTHYLPQEIVRDVRSWRHVVRV